MIPHRYRLCLILAALAAVLASLVSLAAGVDVSPLTAALPPLLGLLGLPADSLDAGPGELGAGLVALLALLVPAAVDAALVERARRDPARPGLRDDHVDPLALARRSAPPPRTLRRRRATVLDDTVPSRRDPPAGPLALALVVLAAACSVASQGCGSPYRQHSTAVVALAAAHTVAHAAADGARTAAMDAVEAEHPPGSAGRTEALRAEHARWQPVAHTLDLVRSALGVYVEALDAARLSDAGEEELLALLLPVLRRVSSLYASAAATLRSLGVDAPAVPPIVDALLGGAP